VQLGRLIYFFLPCGAKDKLTLQLVLCTAMSGLYVFAGGTKEAGHARCSSAPFGSTGSPGNPHTPVLRAVCTHSDKRCREVHHVIQVSKVKTVHFSSAIKIHCTEKKW